MEFTPKMQKAINIATALHDGQKRKADGLPYIVHPFAIALILRNYTENEDVIIAGILHDTVEDTGYTKEEMEKDFGSHVTSIVADLTELPKTYSWQERKDSYLEHLKTTSHESKLVCAADKLHNLQSMRDALEKFGEKALENFKAPAYEKLWFYEECLEIFKEDEKMPPQLIVEISYTILEIEDEERLSRFIKVLSEKD